VLDHVSRDPNPEDLTLQHSIEQAIPDVIRSGGSCWSQVVVRQANGGACSMTLGLVSRRQHRSTYWQ
jgi:hypothetical protein